MVSSAQILGRVGGFVFQTSCVALVLGAAVLAGCGQKGPLFLPVPRTFPVAPVNSGATTQLPALQPAAPASAAK